MAEIRFHVDYDEHPDLGGQQGVFFQSPGKFQDLIGAKIKDIIEENRYLVFVVEKDGVEE